MGEAWDTIISKSNYWLEPGSVTMKVRAKGMRDDQHLGLKFVIAARNHNI